MPRALAAGGAPAPNGLPPRPRSVYEAVRVPPEARSARALPRLLVRGFRLVWRADPRQLLANIVIEAFAAGALVAQLFVARWTLASVLDGATTGRGLAPLVVPLTALIAMTALTTLPRAARGELDRLLGERFARYASDRLHEVTVGLDLVTFESPDFYDRLQRAKHNVGTRPLLLVSGLLSVASGVFSVIGIVTVLAAIEVALIPLALVAVIPLWVASSRNSRALYGFAHAMTADDRRRAYLSAVLTSREHAKDVRANGLGAHLRERHDVLFDERVTRLRAVVFARLRRILIASAGGTVLSAATLALAASLFLVAGRMTVAELGTAGWGLLILGQRLRGLHAGSGALYESALFVEDLTTFLESRVDADDRPSSGPSGLERLVAKRLTFSYPGSARPALVDASLEVRRGEIVALVGENGSGKTTLAKLLAHLYTPASGRILWDGIDTAVYDAALVRRRIAVLFQDFARYHLSAHDNIAFGDVDRLVERARVATAAEHAGADEFLAGLEHGYETILSRMFDHGADLSGGQWQRVALARTIFRDADLVVLDEPTAALDPDAEAQLFRRMRQLADGRAVLLISHRFSTVRSADRIYVLERGRIIEHDTHEQLLSCDGRYATLFRLQAAAYLDDHPVPSR
ncbi:MAG: ABC transporter ATP-binding protein/permease [Actinomycetota bacterium]|nr:ABC transporter ATP-binding protein/permease [Actinomycetota bacterium]